MTHLTKLLLTASAAFLMSMPAFAQTIFIKDAQVVTNANGGQKARTSIVVKNGRIIQIGQDINVPDGAKIVSGEGQWVTPGLFASLTSLGLVEIGAEDATDDTSAKKASTSVSDMAVDGFNPISPIIGNTRVSGVTHAAVIGRASHNIFAGTGFVADMSGAFESVVKPESFVYVQLGSRGGSLAGGSRSASMSQLRAALTDAAAYPSRYKSPTDGDALPRRDAAAFAPAAKGLMPIIIGADRASDLLNIIKLKSEFELDIIIAGAAEGWMVADQLAAAEMKVILDPMANLPGSFDAVGSRLDNPKMLSDAGVDFALMSFSESTSHNVRVLNQHAGTAVANGLSWDEAFAAISSVPAKWFGLNTGNISRGVSDATLVVWDGDPLQVTSAPTFIMIDGKEQSLMSRQRELRDRYNPTRDETRAHKYR